MKTLLVTLLVTGLLLGKALAQQVPDIQPILKSNSNNVRNMFSFNLAHVNIVRSHNVEYRADSLDFKSINKSWVKTLSVLNDSVSLKKYGDKSVPGIVVLTLNDDEHPEAFEGLKKKLTKL